jgi:hypothetical protein
VVRPSAIPPVPCTVAGRCIAARDTCRAGLVARAHVLQRRSLRDARCVLRQVAPPDHAGHFSERLGVLSRHYQYNDHRANYPNVCPSRICAGTGLIPPTSALVLGSPLPLLRRDQPPPRHVCAGTGRGGGFRCAMRARHSETCG